MKLILRLIALMALVSASLYAFAGLPLWAGEVTDGRAFLLGMLHFLALFAGASTYME